MRLYKVEVEAEGENFAMYVEADSIKQCLRLWRRACAVGDDVDPDSVEAVSDQPVVRKGRRGPP